MDKKNDYRLDKERLSQLKANNLQVPPAQLLELPEKVLQFGTGVLLRGLPDYFIDAANRQGIFNGRVLVVKSTSSGGADAFEEQNGLYTICIRGIQKGHEVSKNIICSAISRVLSAQTHWDDIIKAACRPEIKTVISNTTEIGIQYLEESISGRVPESYPGKLLACLYARFKAFNGHSDAGMVILPTELISNNAKVLQEILNRLARYNQLGEAFIGWLNTANQFCNTLVDCIVPGYPDSAFRQQFENDFEYRDQLLIVSEVYRLWAIEGSADLHRHLPFTNLKNGIVIAEDITRFKELKLRLLNGTHTMSCGLAYLSGIETVKEAMEHPVLSAFIRETMLDEIAPAIPYELPLQDAREFANEVLDRFRNPGIAHHWINITLQYSSKLSMRCVPVLVNYYQKFNKVPRNFALGFAAHLLFMRAIRKEGDQYFGSSRGREYPIKDDQAGFYYTLWQNSSISQVVALALGNISLFGSDLNQLPGFAQAVEEQLEGLIHQAGI